jgi:hypothetical protein
MPKISERNPDSAPGDWFIDRRCIDCAASRTVAPGLIVRRNGKSVFTRQPENEGERLAAWRAALVWRRKWSLKKMPRVLIFRTGRH